MFCSDEEPISTKLGKKTYEYCINYPDTFNCHVCYNYNDSHCKYFELVEKNQNSEIESMLGQESDNNVVFINHTQNDKSISVQTLQSIEESLKPLKAFYSNTSSVSVIKKLKSFHLKDV